MAEIPEGFNVSWLPPPDQLVEMWAEGSDVGADRYLVAKYIVEGKTKEELIEYISKLLLGIKSLGRKLASKDHIIDLLKVAM